MKTIRILSCEEEHFITSVLSAQNGRDNVLGTLLIFLLSSALSLIAIVAVENRSLPLLLGGLPFLGVLCYVLYPSILRLVADKRVLSPLVGEEELSEQFQVSYDDDWRNTPYLVPWFYRTLPWPTVSTYRLNTILISSPSQRNIKYIISVEGGFSLLTDMEHLPKQNIIDIFFRPVFLATKRGCAMLLVQLIFLVSTCLLVLVFSHPSILILLVPMAAIVYFSIRSSNHEEEVSRYIIQRYRVLFRQ